MKKYMTPELSELFTLVDVLANSNLDNLGGDPADDGDFDVEDDFKIIAD